MSYVVLARRYRPQQFSDLVGQEHVAATLKNAIKQERFAHAYLFTGPRGVGKTSAARILAKAIRCLDPQDGEPCNKCEACVSITDGKSMDVMEIDAASNTGVDNIRELRENVEYMASVGKYRVYIIDEVHMLSTAAFNALLKTLEEPPPHVIFIFATTELHKVLPTIQSRCQRFDFRRVPEAEMMKNLTAICEKENVTIDEASLRSITLESEGCLRDAQSLLDQAIAFCDGKITVENLETALGLIGRGAYIALFEAIITKDTSAAIKAVNDMLLQGNDPKVLLGRMTQFFRDWHLSYFAGESLISDPDFSKLFVNYKTALSSDEVVRNLDLCLRHQSQLYAASNSEFLLESLAVKLTLLRPAAAPAHAAQANTQSQNSSAASNRPARPDFSNRASNARPGAGSTPPTPPRNRPGQSSPTPPPPGPTSKQPSQVPMSASSDLMELFTSFIRAKKPAWTPVLQSVQGIEKNDDGRVTVYAKGDFAGKRLSSSDGLEVLKLSLGVDNIEVTLDASAVKSEKAATQDEIYQQHKEARDMAREHESVASAVKIFDAKIKDTKILVNNKNNGPGKN